MNDFIDRGRIKKVYIQGEANSRSVPSDLDKWRVRNATGGLVPFSNFSEGNWTFGPQGLNRYNGVPAMQIQGMPVPGVTGEAMLEVENMASQLPPVSPSPGPACRWRNANPATRRPCFTHCRWRRCSCAWLRCTKAGRSPSRSFW